MVFDGELTIPVIDWRHYLEEVLDMHNSHARAMQLPEEGVNLKEMLADLEVELIRQALESQDGVVARAADLLGMRRTTLVEKMKKYGMSKEV